MREDARGATKNDYIEVFSRLTIWFYLFSTDAKDSAANIQIFFFATALTFFLHLLTCNENSSVISLFEIITKNFQRDQNKESEDNQK